MATTFGRDFSEPHAGDPARGDEDDERSVGAALRITLLFVAVVILLLWAGVAEPTYVPGPEQSAASSRP